MTVDKQGGTATIRYYTGENPEQCHYIDLGTITKMTHTIHKKSQVTPIVSLDMQSAFPIETGNSQTISMSFSHVNGQDGMTNTEWYNSLTSFINRWQSRTNGCILNYMPNQDNPYMGDVIEDVGCYIKSISRTYTVDFNEVIKGTIEFVVGTMHVNNSNSKSTIGMSAEENINNTSIMISDSAGERWYAIQYGAAGSENSNDQYNCIESMTMKGGMESPFETVTITMPKKKLMEQVPGLYGDLVDYKNKLIVNCMGNHTMFVDQIRKSGEKVTIRGITYAQYYQQRSLTTDRSDTPLGHIRRILTDPSNGVMYTDDQIKVFIVSTRNADAGTVTFPKGTVLWRILQMCATLLRARIFFADNNAYLIDYTMQVGYDQSGRVAVPPMGYKNHDTLWIPSMTLQDATFYGNRLTQVKEIDEEGFAPVKNSMVATYKYDNDPSDDDKGSLPISDTYSDDIFKTQEKGTVPVTELTKDQAQIFGENFLAYIREPQRPITFSLKEMYGQSGHQGKTWRSLFGPSAQVGEIVDQENSDRVSNESYLDDPSLDTNLEGSKVAYQRLCLSSYVRKFPEGTCEYTFGTVANVDLSNNVAQTTNTLNAPKS